MTKCFSLLLAVAGFLTAGLLAPVEAQDNKKAQDAVKKDRDKLQGTWIVQTAELPSGPFVPGEGMKLIFAGEKVTWIIPAEKTASKKESKVEYKYNLDPSKNPKEITIPLDDPKDKSYHGIYKFDDDGVRLHMCFSNTKDGERPKEFATEQGTGQLLLILKHQPAAKKSGPSK